MFLHNKETSRTVDTSSLHYPHVPDGQSFSKKYIIIPLTLMNHIHDKNIPTQHGLNAFPQMQQGQITEELHRNTSAHPTITTVQREFSNRKLF
jgi:hypothetical protein